MNVNKRILTYVVVIIFSICFYRAKSQDWFEGSPSWEYKYDAWYCDFNIGYDVMRFEKDTLVDNIDMKQFEVYIYRNRMGSITSYSGKRLYYEMDDVVYLFSQNQHYELYNFTHPIGYIDSIAWYSDDTCDSLLFLKLDTIENIEIAGNALRVQKWSQLNDSIHYPNSYTIVEKIGVIDGFPFEARQHWQCHSHSCYPYNLSCYNNEDIGLTYPQDTECVVSAKEVIKNIGTPIVYPNPAQDHISIDIEDRILFMNVYNLTGELIGIWHDTRNVNISGLTPGFYILRIFGSKGDQLTVNFIKL